LEVYVTRKEDMFGVSVRFLDRSSLIGTGWRRPLHVVVCFLS